MIVSHIRAFIQIIPPCGLCFVCEDLVITFCDINNFKKPTNTRLYLISRGSGPSLIFVLGPLQQ